MNIISKALLLTAPSGIFLTATGCGKKPSASPPVKAADATTGTMTAMASAAATATPVSVQNHMVIPQAGAGDSSQVIGALTQALRKYAVEHKGMPRNFRKLSVPSVLETCPRRRLEKALRLMLKPPVPGWSTSDSHFLFNEN